MSLQVYLGNDVIYFVCDDGKYVWGDTGGHVSRSSSDFVVSEYEPQVCTFDGLFTALNSIKEKQA